MSEDFRDILESGSRVVGDLEVEVNFILGKVVGLKVVELENRGEAIFIWGLRCESYVCGSGIDGEVYEGEIGDAEFWGWLF